MEQLSQSDIYPARVLSMASRQEKWGSSALDNPQILQKPGSAAECFRAHEVALVAMAKMFPSGYKKRCFEALKYAEQLWKVFSLERFSIAESGVDARRQLMHVLFVHENQSLIFQQQV
jgi:hypothetical protein